MSTTPDRTPAGPDGTNAKVGPTRIRRRAWVAALVGCAGAGAAIPLVYAAERLSGLWGQHGSTTRRSPPQPFARIEVPAVDLPPVVPAESAGLRDDEPVIGVVVNGRARAYRLAGLRDRTRHVVNDLVGGVPVSVTYCDITDCVRAYSDPGRSGPLDFSVGGLYIVDGSQLVLKYDGSYYFQRSGLPVEPGAGAPSIPVPAIEPTRTTWKDWVARHPDTDVSPGLPLEGSQ